MTYLSDKAVPLQRRSCTSSSLLPVLEEIAAQSGRGVTLDQCGTSAEGRPIMAIGFGSGPVRILLWSQMHGDEPTATLALADIFKDLAIRATSTEWMRLVGERTQLLAIPMLNPDGAERRSRRNACGIDLNRDALALVSPEARLLRDLRNRVNPHYAFNLHDQDLSSVGNRPEPAALALLAPPADDHGSVSAGRRRAVAVAAAIARETHRRAEGCVTAYDDSYEPRAFGDWMQSSGVSTVLVESGHMRRDPEKELVRKLTAEAICGALTFIASGNAESSSADAYAALPHNGKKMLDVIVRNLRFDHPAVGVLPADLGCAVQPWSAIDNPALTVCDRGDLSTLGGLEELEGGGRRVPSGLLELESVVARADLERALSG